MSAKSVPDEIRQILKLEFAADLIEIDDESRKHAGHAGSMGGGHYRIVVISERFSGKPLLERHRLVNDLVFKVLSDKVHALAIRAFTPEEWQNRQKL